MRKTILLALPLLLAAACSRETDPAGPATPEEHTMVFHAVAETPETRTVRTGSGAIYWAPGDVIRIFHGTKSALFTAQTAENAPNTDFVGSLPDDDKEDGPFYALYASNARDAELKINRVSFQGTPGTQEYVTVEVPTEQAVPAGTFAPGAFPSVAVANGSNLYFENLCGGAVLSVRRPGIRKIEIYGNNNERICREITHYYHADPSDFPSVRPTGPTPSHVVTVTPAEGNAFVPGSDYYVSLIPAELTCGLTIRYYTDHQNGVFTTERPITIARSKFGRLRDLDASANWTEEAANCLVIKPGQTKTFQTRFSVASAGSYLAPALQGPGTRAAAGEVHYMETKVLWETLGTSVTPRSGDVVASVSGGADLTIKAGAKEGNAVVALYDNGEIVWSWHVWVTNADLESLAQTGRNGIATAMDRNLGALSATPGDVRALGLLYQWGRKDPFTGASAIGGTNFAATNRSWPMSVYSGSETGTVAYTIANPMQFLIGNLQNHDWLYSGSKLTDDTRWNKDKGIYDPCPAGWKVPERDFWSAAMGYGLVSSGTPWTGIDATKKGVDLQPWMKTGTVCWYPAAGSITIDGIDKILSGTGTNGCYWNCEPDPGSSATIDYSASYMYFNRTTLTLGTHYRADANSVRCVKDKVWKYGDTEDITQEVWDF